MTMPLEMAGRPEASLHARAEQPPQGQGQRWLFELEQALLAQDGQHAARRNAPAELERHAAALETAASATAGVAGSTTATAPAAGGLPVQPLSLLPMAPAAYSRYALPGAAATAMPTASMAATPAGLPINRQAGADVALAAGVRELADMPVRSMAAPLLPASRPPGAMPAALQEAPHSGAAAEAGQVSPELDDIAPRQLHLYRDGDGVHAWIRDAALSETQGRLVAQAMALELRTAGDRLKAMTVNGKMLQVALPAYAQADSFINEQTWQAGSGAAGPVFMTKDAI